MPIHSNNINWFKHYLILLSFVSINYTSFSQSDSAKKYLSPPKSILVIEPQVHSGKLMKIYPVFPQTDFADLNEVNIAIQTAGNKEWHQTINYPQVGLALFYGYLGNNAIMGQNFAAVPNLAFNNRRGKRFWLQTRFGMGFAYFTKHYNAITNPTNLVIGSSINNMTFLALDGNFKLSSHFNFNVGVSTLHFSNGHYQLPNLGANIPSVNVGISYFPVAKPAYYKRDSITHPVKKLLFNMNFGYGRHEFGSATKATGGPKYNVFQGALYVSKRWRQICNVHLGVFVSYYADYYDFIVSEEMFKNQQHLKSTVITVFLGHEWMIGHFGLVAQSGINVYNPFLKEYRKQLDAKTSADLGTYISNKVGIHYYVWNPMRTTSKNLYFGMYLKANFGTADFAEIAMGYSF